MIIIIKRRPYSDGRHSETATCRRRWRCDCTYTDPNRTQPATSSGGRRFPAPSGDRPPPEVDGEGTLFLCREWNSPVRRVRACASSLQTEGKGKIPTYLCVFELDENTDSSEGKIIITSVVWRNRLNDTCPADYDDYPRRMPQ